jgi:hypothetical protein
LWTGSWAEVPENLITSQTLSPRSAGSYPAFRYEFSVQGLHRPSGANSSLNISTIPARSL